MLRFYTFGGLRIERDGQRLRLPVQKARDLLAYLLTFHDRLHPRAVLIGVLWPDLAEEKARRRLSDTLWRVRQMSKDCIVAEDERIWLDKDAICWLDVEQFVLKSEVAGSEPRLDSPAVDRLREAIKLYQGPFLPGFYQDWALLERERLRGLYLQDLGRLLAHYKQIAEYPAALRMARRLVTVEPLHEAAHRELMRLYHLLGRDGEAVAQYRRCQDILQQELGASPAAETQALYQTLNREASVSAPEQAGHLPVPTRHPAPALDRLPLVGRDAVRSALLAHLESAAAGQGNVILLEGEPGIGKSRLAQEIVAGARWRNIATASAAAQSNTAASYAPLLAVLTQALSALRGRQLTQVLDVVHLQALAPLLPPIAQALPDLSPASDLPPAEARHRLQRAFIALILGLGRIVPHLWVIEDLQWADAETLSLLPLLLPRLRESRTLFLLTGRSAELRANPSVWDVLQALDRAGPFPRYTLNRLERDEIAQLVYDLLEEEDAALTDRLARESEGVPFYAVEALKSWRDEGCLGLDERGRWHWYGDIAQAPRIRSGQAIVDHRLSRLSSAGEDVLAAAAVIGLEIDFDLLASVCQAAKSDEVDSERYLRITDELLRLGFLIEADAGYRFSHEQVRQAVYDRLSLSQRRHLHRQVALSVEDLFPDQFELLAHHYLAADQREPAIRYLIRAAERARTLFAHRAALACYDRLLDLLARPDDRAARYDVLHKRAEVLGWVGDRDAQGRDLEKMIALGHDLADDTRLAQALYLRSEWHRIQGRYGLAIKDAEAALHIYQELEDDHGRARSISQLGHSLLDTDDPSRAAAFFREALPIQQDVGDQVGQIECLMGLARVAQYEGDLFQAQMYCQRSLCLARDLGDVRRIGHALSSVGLGYVDLGDMAAAESYLLQALELAQTSAERRQVAVTRIRLAHVALQRDDLAAAKEQLEFALRTLRQVGDVSWAGYARSLLGEVELVCHNAAAYDHLDLAYRRHQELGEHDYAAIDLSYLALAELALGHEERAWDHSQQVVSKAEAEWPGAECPPEIYHNHYQIAKATRRWAAARTALEKAGNVLDQRAKMISDPTWRESYRVGLRVNQAITAALARQPSPGQLRVRLARADVPAHRRPTPEETVAVVWTVDGGADDAALAEQEGKVALRRHRIRRLLDEAQAAGALPTVADLAGALSVSSRTIRSDLAALRDQGHTVPTRGHRA